MPDFDFQLYLEFVQRHYSESQSLYTPTDAMLPLKVQWVERDDRTSGEEGNDRQSSQKIEQFLVLDGLRKYALGDDREHLLLAGRPGSGKSMALQQLAVALAKERQIPVLVQLKGDRSVSELIKAEFRRAKVRVTDDQIEDWLFANRLVLLLDGVNEIPTEKLRQDLAQFREDNLSVPMVFTTRDLAIGGDLGIRKRFEMKPLSPEQLHEFVGKYLPGQGERLLGQLRDRLKEISETPLLLKMLCGVFDPETGQIPQNKGELFREFDRKYEKFKGLPAVSVDFRRFKSEVLQHLAFVMMTGDEGKPTELELTIDRRTAEKAIEDFVVGRVSNPGAKAKEWLEDLLEHHLLQVAADDRRVEFRHQLFQEYYAAEMLLVMFGNHHLDVMEKDQFQHFYLNYLKWTETIAIALSLMKDEKEAVRVVELALDVDLMLGARLAGEVRSDFQERTVGVLHQQKIRLPVKLFGMTVGNHLIKIPLWLLVTLLGKTTSETAIPILLNALENSDSDVRIIASEALANIGSKTALQGLLKAIKHPDTGVRRSAAKALGIIGSELAISGLLKAIEDSDFVVCMIAASWLGSIGSEFVILRLLKALQDADSFIRARAAFALGIIGSESEIPDLLKVLEDADDFVRKSAAESLYLLGVETDTPTLFAALEDLNAIQDFDTEAYESKLTIFDAISPEDTLPNLLRLLKNSDGEVRWDVVRALSEFQADRAAHILPNLIQLLPTESGKEAFQAIQGIQSNCKFYNYEIHQSKLRKADRTSREGGGGDRTLHVTYNIDRVGNLNTGTVNLHGNQNGEQ